MFGRVGPGFVCRGVVVASRGCRSSVGVFCVGTVVASQGGRCGVRTCGESRVWLCYVVG